MPIAGKNNKMEFKGPKLSQVKHPVVIYYDFEAMLQKVDDVNTKDKKKNPNDEDSYTQKIHKHTPVSWRI